MPGPRILHEGTYLYPKNPGTNHGYCRTYLYPNPATNHGYCTIVGTRVRTMGTGYWTTYLLDTQNAASEFRSRCYCRYRGYMVWPGS